MTETLPDFEDHRVQLVYEILCDCELHGKPREEHWEGWQARRIVAALTTPPSVPVGYFYKDVSEDGVEWKHLADNQVDADRFLPNQVVPLYRN